MQFDASQHLRRNKPPQCEVQIELNRRIHSSELVKTRCEADEKPPQSPFHRYSTISVLFLFEAIYFYWHVEKWRQKISFRFNIILIKHLNGCVWKVFLELQVCIYFTQQQHKKKYNTTLWNCSIICLTPIYHSSSCLASWNFAESRELLPKKYASKLYF